MEAICFAVFIPFFFVMSGLTLDVHALFHDARSFILVPVFLAMFVVVRGSPVLLYRSELRKEERLPFALYSATELPMVVAITEIGVRLNIMGTEIATALIGAGLLSVLLFPAIADAMLVPPPVQSRMASATD
jgi:Kef-type K+ transport system membrane component KefB